MSRLFRRTARRAGAVLSASAVLLTLTATTGEASEQRDLLVEREATVAPAAGHGMRQQEPGLTDEQTRALLRRAGEPELHPRDVTPQDRDGRRGSLLASAPQYGVTSWGYQANGIDPRVGRLLGVNADGRIGSCTGTLVARNLVLTAAHCVGHEGFVFNAGQYGSRVHSQWVAKTAWVPNAYEQSGGSGAWDWALVEFGTDGSGRYPGDVLGWFAIMANAPANERFSYGYPSEGYFNEHCRGTDSCYPVYCQSALGGYNKELSDSSVTYGGYYEQGFGCYMTGGSSGGPVFTSSGGKWYITGVNSHGQHGVRYACDNPKRNYSCFWSGGNMWSPYFNETVIAIWKQYART